MFAKMQVIEKVPRNGYENGTKDNVMFEYRFQREDENIQKALSTLVG